MSVAQKSARKRGLTDGLSEDFLTKKLFGNSSALPSSTESSSEDEDEDEGDDTVHIDTDTEPSSNLKAVWHDDDDDELIVELPTGKRKDYLRKITDVEGQKLTAKDYEQRLREAFNRTGGANRSKLKWASIETTAQSRKKNTSCDSDFEDLEEAVSKISASASKYITTSQFLPKGILNFKRMNDITRGHRLGKKPLNSVQFHPTKPVLMTAGDNGVLSLYEVGLPPSMEAFLQDTQFKDFPITTARFSSDGTKIIAGSRRQAYLFLYSVLDGKVSQMKTPKGMTNMNSGSFVLSPDGNYIAIITRSEINILSIATMEVVCLLSTSSMVRSLQFSPVSANSLIALTETSEVCIWDIRNPGGVQSFRDDGGVRGTVLRISYNNQFLACGSNTGIVNLYEMKDIYESPNPKPIKVFDQLTTKIDDVVFNRDSQMMLISSNVKNNAVRLAHIRSRTIFTNFPSKFVNVGKPTVSDFSPNGGYIAVGDTNGYLSLFRLHYFENY